MQTTKSILIKAALAGLLLTGCGGAHPLRGGKAQTRPGMTIAQPENPATPARQASREDIETVIKIPAGSEVYSYDISPNDSGGLVTNHTRIVPKSPTEMVRRSRQSAETELGAAQKDTARELSAKLSAVRPIQFLGIALLLAGVAMLHPAVKALGGSTTLQIGCWAVGAGLVFLPMLIAGHEALILICGLGGCAGLLVWWHAHRHGHMRATIEKQNPTPSPNEDK